MPELPEVSVVVKYLNENIVNEKVKDVSVIKEKLLRNSDVVTFSNLLSGQKVTKVRRRGKYILIDFEKNTVVIHLRMEGKLRVEQVGDFETQKHDYVFFNFESNDVLIYNDTRMFGTIEIVNYLDELSLKGIVKLGLEYKSDKLDAEYMLDKLKNRKQAIKTTLLSQDIFVGLGNIYVDEVLFAAKIHPLTPSNLVTKQMCDDILKHSVLIMDKAIECGGSSVKSYTSGKMRKGTYQNYLKVYGRQNLECLVCQREKIAKIKVNGRGTHFCPYCQKEL